MKEKISPVLALLVFGCFLTPILGGAISSDSLPLDTNLFTALAVEPTLPMLQHALIALPFLIALGVLFARRKVLQMPSRTLGLLFATFFGVIAASFAPSPFKGSSLPSTLEWISYGAALYATVCGAGRRQGPRFIAIAAFAGCSCVALRGLREFGEMRALDPNWRIFAGMVNPNALAALLLVGIFLGIGLTITEEVKLARILCGLFTLIQLWALRYTYSLGGIAVLMVGLFLLGGLCLIWSPKRAGKLAPLGAFLLVACVAGCTLAAPIAELASHVDQSVKITSADAGASRLSGRSLGSDQSFYFRRLLWKGTEPLLREYPTGVGMGNYRYYSAKSGLTTQTQLAHESYLQLGVEATLLTPLVLAAALILWALHATKAPAGLPWRQNVLRASIVAAIFSVLAHNVIDGDLYYYGIGLLTFALIGASLLLSADAVAPEFTPSGLRLTGVAAVVLLGLGMFYSGTVEMIKARLRYELIQRDAESATSDAASVMSMAPYDGEAWVLASRAASNPKDAMDRLERAVDLGPSTKNLRALAYAQEQAEQTGMAISTFNRALELDPNNLVTLFQLMKFEESIDESAAARVAQRLVDVENTLYFKIRSLPEIVPTETFAAREYLAGQTSSPRKKVDLLLPALRGYVEYAHRTVGLLVSQQGNDYGDETLKSAMDKMTNAEVVAATVQRAAVATGDRAAAVEAADAGKVFEAALAKAAGSASK